MVGTERNRYLLVSGFRMLLALAALVVAARAAHDLRSDARVWFLAMLFAASASALLHWPLVIPHRNGSAVYSLGSSFFLAGMFLLPTGPLVTVVAFSIALAGVIAGTRFHRIIFDLSLGVLAYGGTSLLLHLAPRPSDAAVPYISIATMEALLALTVLVAVLVVRSIAMRLERGAETPHWGAFRGPALIEALYCVVIAVTISLLTRLHPALLSLIYVEIGVTLWFLSRYRRRVRDLMAGPQASGEHRRWAACGGRVSARSRSRTDARRTPPAARGIPPRSGVP